MKFGFHIGLSELREDWDNNLEMFKKEDIGVLQMFAGAPMSVNFPKKSATYVSIIENVDVIIHSPYWVTFFNDKVKNLQRKYIGWISKEFSSKKRKIKYVTHIGIPPKDMSQDEMVRIICTEIKKIKYNSSGMEICLENLAGKKTLGNVSLKSLSEVCDKLENVKMCLDTEHAYAAGEDLSSVDFRNVSVVHLNPIPEYVAFGGHLDRHSYSTLEHTKKDIWPLIDNIRKCNVDMIMERRDKELAYKDINIIRDRYKNCLSKIEEIDVSK